ncbi:MAG: class I SAM-dependent methyltransferase [Pirellulales bacterium]|nr:class I SAM-dependent methyltransferase [Pirellulales bacterium]
MLRLSERLVHKMGRWFIEKITRLEYESQNPRRINERAVEYGFVFSCLAELAPSTVLDVGTGRTALPSLLKTCGYRVTAVDNIKDYWPKSAFNRHFYVLNDDITNSKLNEKYDVVVCISVLEHVVEYESALETMVSLTKPGGHLIISCPYSESTASANCYEEEGSYGSKNPYICRQFTRLDFQKWLDSTGAEILKQQYWQFFESKYWSCGKQIQPPKIAQPEEQHQLACMLIRVPAQ